MRASRVVWNWGLLGGWFVCLAFAVPVFASAIGLADSWWMELPLSLRPQILLLHWGGVMAFSLARHHQRSFFCLVCGSLNFVQISFFLLSVPPPAEEKRSSVSMRILQWNVWYENEEEVVLRVLYRSDADLILLQEVGFSLQSALRSMEGNYEIFFTDELAFLARRQFALEVQEVVTVPLAGQRSAQECRVYLEGHEANILNVHLEAPLTPKRFRIRNQQWGDIKRWWAVTAGPKLLFGDFNTSPWAEVFPEQADGMPMRWSSISIWELGTWPSKLPLWLTRCLRIPIDHGFYGSEFSGMRARVAAHGGSNHLPIVHTLYL